MNIAELFIRRPVMTTLVMLGILLFGIMGYRALPISDLPNVDFPTIQVSAALPGASPETMASSVATPLEKQFSTIAGLDNMNSTSTQGSTQITLQFNLARSLDGAALDVQSAISAAARQLPPNMPSPPSFLKVNPADQPILYLTLTSATLPLSQLDEYGEVMMAQRISTVSGVAQVQVYGPQKYAVRVQLDPRALASRGIGIDEASQAVQNANVNLPTGILYGPATSFTVQANGQLTEASAYRPIVVAYRNGSPVRLTDVGRVIDGVENDKTAAWYNDERSISLAIFKQPGTNTVAVATAVRKLLPTFQKQLPAAATLHILYDRSTSIRNSVDDVRFTLLLTLALVVLVIFLFLRNLSATVIPSLFDRRHVRRHVPARLQPRQPFLDGSHSLCRFRRGRRHRHAREHRPPHGTRRRRLRGLLEGLEGNRFHDPVHDDLARRRLHSHSLHGRDRRPPLSRVRCHDRRGDLGLWVCVPVADTHALQPLFEAPAGGEAWPVLSGDRARVRFGVGVLWTNAALRIGSHGQGARFLGAGARGDLFSLRENPQGLSADGGPGIGLRLYGRRSGNRF
jgi:hypothetical protein